MIDYLKLDKVGKRVFEIIGEIYRTDIRKIELKQRLEDLGNSRLDSWLDKVELAMYLGDTFNINIPYGKWDGKNPVIWDIVNYIRGEVSEKTNKNEKNQTYNKDVL